MAKLKFTQKTVEIQTPRQLVVTRRLRDKYTLYLNCDTLNTLDKIGRKKGLALSRIVDEACRAYLKALGE
jgi:hypothetical protein